jgi:hypothetical protein
VVDRWSVWGAFFRNRGRMHLRWWVATLSFAQPADDPFLDRMQFG